MIDLKQFTLRSNAGDAASSRIVEHLTGHPTRLIGDQQCDHPNLLAIGSILQWADAQSTVWGTGFIRGDAKPRNAPKAVLAVRGPLTRNRLRELGIDCPDLYGDPGIFLPALMPPADFQPHKIGIVPHYVDRLHPFVVGAQARGYAVIDPGLPLEDYVYQLTSCRHIIASSLHGIVFAHAYGIPAAWILLSQGVKGDGFKFRDYYASVGLPPQPLSPETSLNDAVDACTLPAIDLNRDDLLGEIRAAYPPF